VNTYEGATCACGSTWFRLEDDDQVCGVVTLDHRGMVTGVAGRPVCVECGETWAPRRDRLRIVQ
jgi:hypothetical protein